MSRKPQRKRRKTAEGEGSTAKSNSQNTHDPHDGLFKETFESVEEAASLLRSGLPLSVSERIDWSSLELVSTEYRGQWLDRRYGDLLFRAKLRVGDKWVYIDVLLEHQSTSLWRMPLRMLGMMTRRYETLVRNDAELRQLPILLPVVLFQGEGQGSYRGWRHATRFSDLLDADPETIEAFRPYIPDFEFVLDDLGQQTVDALFARSFPPVAYVTLRLLRDARNNPQLLEELSQDPRELAVWQAIVQSPNGELAYVRFWMYLYETFDAPNEAIHAFARTVGKAAEEAEMTAAQRLIEKVAPELEAEGAAATLQRQIAFKFKGEVDAAVLARVDQATMAQLERWTDRILTAQSLDELFAD